MAGVPRRASSGRAWCSVTTAERAGVRLGHLARRFFGALSTKPPGTDDEVWAVGFLQPGEEALWRKLSNADRRHSIEVARRFSAEMGESERDDMAAALLHDIGKLACELGTFSRVFATVIGPRTRRFRLYHQHEQIGADMLRSAGSDARTVALVESSTERRDVLAALHRADNV